MKLLIKFMMPSFVHLAMRYIHIRLVRPLMVVAIVIAIESASLPFASAALTNDNPMADGGNANGFDMAPETTLAVVNAAVEKIPTTIPPGPFAPTWDSLKENYQVPQWFVGAKFGLFMH
jgi:hypothetical protein